MPLVAEIGDAVQTNGETTVAWSIRDIFSLSDKADDHYLSPVFSFADSRWFLSLYPNEETSRSSAGSVGLYLMREDAGESRTIEYTFGIKCSDGVDGKIEVKHEFSKAYEGFGFPKFYSRSKLRKQASRLMPNDFLVITCHLKYCDRNTSKAEKKFKKSLLSMLEDGEDSDVVIEVQGKEFPAHRCILRARSPVFRSMFSHDMVEKRNNVVTIEDCDPETFQDFLVHIYSESCDHISMNNVSSLYVASDKYDVGELKEACAEFMNRNINIACFGDFITLALKHEEKNLIDRATEFFCDNSVDIAKTAKWQTFLKENSIAANELFIKAMSK